MNGNKLLSISLFAFILFLVQSGNNYSQTYKGWFFDSNIENCGVTAVGYAKRSWFGDTAAINIAFINACQNFARNEYSYFKGGQAFWSTEIGTAWMGNNFQLQYDTSNIELYKERVNIIDTLISKDFLAILISNGDCSLSNESKIRKLLNKFSKPIWIEKIPSDDNFIYAVGNSPEYFNEVSSWIAAENEAIKNLALQSRVTISALLKKENQTGEITKDEQTEIFLKNMKVIGRWKDSKSKIFYILISMPKTK